MIVLLLSSSVTLFCIRPRLPELSGSQKIPLYAESVWTEDLVPLEPKTVGYNCQVKDSKPQTFFSGFLGQCRVKIFDDIRLLETAVNSLSCNVRFTHEQRVSILEYIAGKGRSQFSAKDLQAINVDKLGLPIGEDTRFNDKATLTAFYHVDQNGKRTFLSALSFDGTSKNLGESNTPMFDINERIETVLNVTVVHEFLPTAGTPYPSDTWTPHFVYFLAFDIALLFLVIHQRKKSIPQEQGELNEAENGFMMLRGDLFRVPSTLHLIVPLIGCGISLIFAFFFTSLLKFANRTNAYEFLYFMFAIFSFLNGIITKYAELASGIALSFIQASIIPIGGFILYFLEQLYRSTIPHACLPDTTSSVIIILGFWLISAASFFSGRWFMKHFRVDHLESRCSSIPRSCEPLPPLKKPLFTGLVVSLLIFVEIFGTVKMYVLQFSQNSAVIAEPYDALKVFILLVLSSATLSAWNTIMMINEGDWHWWSPAITLPSISGVWVFVFIAGSYFQFHSVLTSTLFLFLIRALIGGLCVGCMAGAAGFLTSFLVVNNIYRHLTG